MTYEDQEKFFNRFYKRHKKSIDIKIKQDAFILKYSQSSAPKREKPTTETRGKNKLAAKYFIFQSSTKKVVRVCQKAFLDTLRVSHNRVNGVILRHFETGEMPEENRGGNRKRTLYLEKKKSVKDFIKKFNVLESHYCRESLLDNT